MKRIPFLYVLSLILCAPILVSAQNPPISVNKEDKKAEVGGVVKSRMLEAGPQLVIQNVPGIPLELVESVKKYTESKGVGGGSWHPIKREMLIGIDKSKILFMVEDRSRVVEMWRSEGLVCLQCAPGEF